MTLREISLLRRLQAKEIQVNSLLETLTALSQNPASRPPPPPLPGSLANSIPIHDIPPLLDSSSDSPVAIPKALLPVLAQLRARTQQLVEENTLLKSLLEEEEEIVTPAGSEGKGEGKEREVAAGIAEAKPTKRKGGRIDLKKVVERTKLLTKENEELGAALEEFEGWASVRGERTRYEESIRGTLGLDLSSYISLSTDSLFRLHCRIARDDTHPRVRSVLLRSQISCPVIDVISFLSSAPTSIYPSPRWPSSSTV